MEHDIDTFLDQLLSYDIPYDEVIRITNYLKWNHNFLFAIKCIKISSFDKFLYGIMLDKSTLLEQSINQKNVYALLYQINTIKLLGEFMRHSYKLIVHCRSQNILKSHIIDYIETLTTTKYQMSDTTILQFLQHLNGFRLEIMLATEFEQLNQKLTVLDNKLNDTNERLSNLEYAPGAIKYHETKEHFDSLNIKKD